MQEKLFDDLDTIEAEQLEDSTGTQFARFTSTKVQSLTPEGLRASAESCGSAPPDVARIRQSSGIRAADIQVSASEGARGGRRCGKSEREERERQVAHRARQVAARRVRV